MTDYLASWWTIPVEVERFTGTGPSGDVFAAATTEMVWVEDTRQLVRAADGSQVVSSTRIFGPVETAYVPSGSRVTLPVAFGTPPRRTTVIATSVHSGGGQPTPDHIELALA